MTLFERNTLLFCIHTVTNAVKLDNKWIPYSKKMGASAPIHAVSCSVTKFNVLTYCNDYSSIVMLLSICTITYKSGTTFL